jgi:hypothetical protein
MEHLNPSTLVQLGLEVLTVLGVGPAVLRWLHIGRRARMASLVAQLAQEALIAVARRKGVAPAEASQMDEAVEMLRQRLVASGMDPKKASDAARAALAGAAHPAEDLAAEARKRLLGEK